MRTAFARLRSNGIPHVVASNVVQQGTAFLSVVLIAKILGPSDFALIRIALAYVAIAVVVAGGGLTAPVLRYCADVSLVTSARQRLLSFAIGRVALISAATVAMLCTASFLHYGLNGEAAIYASYALQLPALASATLLLVYLQAMQLFKALALAQIVIRVVSLVVTTLAAYLWGLLGFLLAALTLAYLVCIPLWRLAKPCFSRTEAASIPGDFHRLAVYSMIGTLITTVGQYSDVILLDLTGAPRESIAIYSLATIFFFAAGAVIGAVQSVATPGFTTLINEPEQFRRKLFLWTVSMTAVGVPMALMTVLVAYVVESWVLGNAYSGMTALLMILMIKFCLWCSYAIGGAALVGIGAIKQGMWIATVTTAISIVLGYVLCLYYGAWGAAWAQVAVSVVAFLVIWRVIVQQVRQLHDRPFERE